MRRAAPQPQGERPQSPGHQLVVETADGGGELLPPPARAGEQAAGLETRQGGGAVPDHQFFGYGEASFVLRSRGGGKGVTALFRGCRSVRRSFPRSLLRSSRPPGSRCIFAALFGLVDMGAGAGDHGQLINVDEVLQPHKGEAGPVGVLRRRLVGEEDLTLAVGGGCSSPGRAAAVFTTAARPSWAGVVDAVGTTGQPRSLERAPASMAHPS